MPRATPRDPLWADLQDACLRADMERLGDIGDAILAGVPIELFDLTENERLFIDGYLGKDAP